MADKTIREKAITTALIGCASIGFVYLLYRRTNIFNTIKNIFSSGIHNSKIEVIEDVEHCHKIITKIKKDCEKYQVLGFDCEWVTVGGTRRPMALLQLASYSGICALIRLCKLKHIPMLLREILEDDKILKVGVIPKEDAIKLAHDFGVGVSSTLDLRFLAIRANRKPEGMANMAKSLLNMQLDKNWRISCSDWEANVLSKRQIDYAAKDALVALEAFKIYSKEIVGQYWFTSKTLEEFFISIEPFIDMPYKDSYGSNLNKLTSLQKDFGSKNSKASKTKPYMIKRKMSHSARTKAFYDNCMMQAPDGELLCTCERRKAQWYLDQNLAELINKDPFTIRLNFEPSGRAVGNVGNYYKIPKENKCVVCGGEDAFIRKNVVPREYRKYFPEVMKSHTSHDVLLLCPKCHQLSNISDIKVRQYLAEKCNAPLAFQEGASKFIENPRIKKIRSAAKALLYNVSKIPVKRKEELEKVLLAEFPEQNLDTEFLEFAANAQVLEAVENYVSHGEKVVEKFQTDLGGLNELEKLWRIHFLDTMKPKFMPEYWSVEHNKDRLEIRANEGRVQAEELLIAGLNPDLILSNSSATNKI